MLTLTSALDRAARLYGSRNAIIDDERTYTWREFVDRVARAASVLNDLGVRPGERFGTFARNSYRHNEIVHAGYWLGAVPVPINIRLAADEVRYILDDAQCKILAIEDTLWDFAHERALAPWQDRLLYIAAQAADVEAPQYEPLMATAAPLPAHDAGEDDDAILIYSGGTTGRSKGVRLSHRNVIANGLQVAIAMGARRDDVYMHVAPMFHAADLLGTAFTLVGGAHVFLLKFSGQDLLQAIQAHGVTVAMLAPTMVIMTLQEESFVDFDLSSFRMLFYGSSPMAAEWVRRAMEAFPNTEFQQGYGLSETSPILTTLDPDVHKRAMESGEHEILKAAGHPVAGVDLKIVGEHGDEVPAGEIGEVVVRGPNIAKGYLNRADENEKAFRDGWFQTGDLGRVDGEGFLFLVDRKKDMVITGGENVYTSEVEAALYQHPDVFEAAVIGVPYERYGEALMAVIVPQPGVALSDDDVIQHCRGRIGGYKIPRKMAFVDALPKSAMGKILKTELRKTYGAT